VTSPNRRQNADSYRANESNFHPVRLVLRAVGRKRIPWFRLGCGSRGFRLESGWIFPSSAEPEGFIYTVGRLPWSKGWRSIRCNQGGSDYLWNGAL
jgi:hypothetical protein